MRKIQILFPEPQLRRLRWAAKRRDCPVSEIVRRATEAWLDRMAPDYEGGATPMVPTFSAGKPLVGASRLRELAYSEREDLS